MEKMTPPADVVVELPNRQLVEQALHFSKAFLRWVDGRGEGSLSYPRLRVMESLHCNGPARMRDLADELSLPARNLTTIADGLEAEDLVRRTAHPTDRRVTLLELTAAGREAVAEALAPRLLQISALFDVLPPAEKTTLLVALETLAKTIDETHGP
jgi:DNA-binding MarR family transcriptional regulator